MRFLSALLFVALTGSVTLADEAKPADPKPEVSKRKVPLRVVRLLPETHQVLLFDRTKGTHVVAEVGQDVDGYLVDEIDDDEVTLVSPSGSDVILTAPDQTWRRRAAERKAAAGKPVPAAPATDPATGATAQAEPAPEDPYGDSEGPKDPYADPSAAPARSVSPPTAHIVAGEDGVRVESADTMDPAIAAFVEAVGATPPGPSASPSPSVAATPETSSPPPAVSKVESVPAAGPTTATIKRADIDAALANFATTASTFRAGFTDKGLRFDEVASGSLLSRVGLAKGDVVTSVDGQPLHSLDDAANLYARLPTARGTTLQVLRAGKPVTLRVSIQ